MTEQLRFHTLDELQALSLDELQALWDLVPTDRQRAYRAAYDREVRSAGALGSDALERQVAAELLQRYHDSALVPLGSRWARTPQRLQDAARKDDLPAAGEPPARAVSHYPPDKRLLLVGLLGLLLLPVLLRALSASPAAPALASAPTATLTPAPRVTPSPTPLALEAQDDVISGGDRDRALAYPVSLQVLLPHDPNPRVWVVQRRTVRAAQWHYDPNPDIASFLSGMAVRPVIGIPHSPDNAAFFQTIQPGTRFTLTLNTGAILRYEFAAKTDVRRSDTTIFRQVSPGLVLLLIGQTDADGLPAATRTLVTATYPPDQELTRSGDLVGPRPASPDAALGQPLTLSDLATLTLTDVQPQSDADPAHHTLRFHLDLHAADIDLDTTFWRVQLVDPSGQVFLPAAVDLPPFVPARARFPLTLTFLTPPQLRAGRLILADGRGHDVAFRFDLPSPPTPPPTDRLDARLISVTTTDGQIITRLRLYNGHATPLTFTPDDLWLALGYAPDPPGPRNPAEGMPPFELLPEQAVNLTLVWYYADEPYAALQVGPYRWAVQLSRSP